MNTIVHAGRAIASARCLILTCLLLLAAADLAAQEDGINPADVVVLPLSGTPKTMFQSFNNVDLTNGVAKQLDVVGNPADNYCAQPRTIRHAQVDLRLKMGPTSYEFGRQTYRADVLLFVDELDATNTPIVPTRMVTMSIGYSTGNPNIPEQLYSFDVTSDYPSLDHIVVSAQYVAIPGNPNFPAPATASLQNNIRLEASYSEEFDVNPLRPGSGSANPIVQLVSQPDNVTANPVTFTWNVGTSGEGCSDDFPDYQFQLLRLFNRDPAKTTDESDIVDTVHWERATTFETGSSATQLKLALAEGRGYYVWRVRPIGSDYPGGIADDRNWGVWSVAPVEGEILALTNVDRRDISDAEEKKSVFFSQQFDDDLNWIYTRSFSEGSEGTRIGEKISYANGLANVRQSQIHLRTQDSFLVSQVAYDFSGRPAVKSLEAPIRSASGGFGYYGGFLKHKTGVSTTELYTAKNFDAGTTTGTFQNPDPVDAGPLDAYYSDTNPDLQIPNAGGYAFTRALYSQDGTSRVKEQSGVGTTMRVRKGAGVTDRTTKTLYSGVSDFELIGMFGDEAPDAASVHKVITIDPNKVASVQYISKEGQTIATCLAKDQNDLLAELNLEHELGGTVEQTINGDPTMGDHDKSTRLATTKPTDVTLTYTITPKVIQSACGSYCSTCDYKVIFSAYNVEDPTDFHKDSIFLPAGACSPLEPTSTTITWHLDGPATYVIERRVVADNTIPGSQSADDPDGKSYLEMHRAAMYQIARDQVTSALDSVYKLIDSTSLDRLYAYLDTANGGIYRTGDNAYTIHTSCCTITIPKELCEDFGCTSPLPSFEQMLYDRWGPDGTKWPNGHGYPKTSTTNVDFGTSLDKYFFTSGPTPIYPHSGSFSGGTGAFDAMIQHMIDDGYDCARLLTAWTALVESFGIMATHKGDGNPEDVNGDFNLLDAFLNTVGKEYVGTSDCPYGDCGSGHGLGYLEYAYKYFRYDASNYSADCESICGYAGHGSWGQDTLDAYYPEKQEWRVFYECVYGAGRTLESLSPGSTLPSGCGTADTNCWKSMALAVEDTCRSACQGKFWGFVESIKDAYHHVGKTVEGDKYKVDTRTGEDRDPSGYVLANGEYDISLRQIYCEAEALVSHCSDSCTLTVFRSGTGPSRKIDSIGSPDEHARILRAMTYSYKIGIYNSLTGECEDTTGHEDPTLEHISHTTSGSAYAARMVAYMNDRLAAYLRAGYTDYELCTLMVSIFRECFGTRSCTWQLCGSFRTKKPGDGLLSRKGDGASLQTDPCPSLNPDHLFDNLGPGITGQFFIDENCNLCFRQICTLSETPETDSVVLCNSICDMECSADICFKWIEPSISDTTWKFTPIPCEQEVRGHLRSLISQQAERCIESQVVDIAQQYLSTCSDPKNVQDLFKISYDIGYYHFTLYYYNRAGKLIRTVPPNGVDLSKRDRASHPNHTFVTLYDYDSFGEVTQQSSPDGGMAQFYYDDQGKLRFSQTAEQMVPGPLLPRFSYTKYDQLGRSIETGESYRPLATSLAAKVNDPNYPTIGTHSRVSTTYTNQAVIGYLGDPARLPRFTQNRIAYTATDDGVITYYSYDPHGNIEWLIRQIPGLGNNYIRYEYDLVGDNLLKICYNEGKADQFFHRYSYDADNRMTKVETSRDGKIWDRDAQYTYYAYGPLRRILTGEDSLQGTDYTYTIEGWLKGINHPKIDAVGVNDPGRDALGSSRVGADAIGMAYGYYDGDYLRKRAAVQSPFNSATTGVYTAQAYNLSGGNLYNGNIVSWSSQLLWSSLLPSPVAWPPPPNGPPQLETLTGYTYAYDRLNRLLSDVLKVYNAGPPGAWMASTDYTTGLSYDPNGNILTLSRNGWAANPFPPPPPINAGQKMDRLTYKYSIGGGTPSNNLLQYVAEDPTVNSGSYTTDIDNQNSAGNYHYDLAGHLIADDQEGELIKWDPYGKVRTVKTPNQTITIFYDAAGNRVKKFAADDNASTATATYYVRSADEKVLAIYSQSLEDGNGARYVCRATLTPDNDGDGRPDAPVCDNCPGTAYNPFQEDYDGDGVGDACDPCPWIPSPTQPQPPCPPPATEADIPPAMPPAPGSGPQWNITQTRLAELLIYGNTLHERFATVKPWTDRDSTLNPDEVYFTREMGKKFYELKDHLGDVRVVFSDIKIGLGGGWHGGVTVAPGSAPFMVDMVAYNNYYPFGMEQPARCYADGSYRYGFNGKESDNELNGNGNSYDYGARVYNPRLGRFLSVDPLTSKFADLTPYQFASNTPIRAIDMDGLESHTGPAATTSTQSWKSYFQLQSGTGYEIKFKKRFTITMPAPVQGSDYFQSLQSDMAYRMFGYEPPPSKLGTIVSSGVGMVVSGSEVLGGSMLTLGTDGVDGGMGAMAAMAAWGDFSLNFLTFTSAVSPNSDVYSGPSSTAGIVGHIVAGETGEQVADLVANLKTVATEHGLKRGLGVLDAASSANSLFGSNKSSPPIGYARMQMEAAEEARLHPPPQSPVPLRPAYTLPGSNSQSESNSTTLLSPSTPYNAIDGTACSQPLINFLHSH